MVNTGNGQTNVTVLIDRTDLLNGFFGRELGLFAKIGESGTEQLFCYTNAGALSDYIPSGDDGTIPYNEFIDIETIIGNASNVSIIVDQTKVYVTRDELNMAVEELEDKIDGIQVFEGSTASVDGKKGLVPQPLKADVGKYLTTEGWKALLLASQAEAEAGTNNDKIMTPLRVNQAMGTMTFIDLLPVGWLSYKEFLLPQHVKANGATVNRSDYPTLAAYATEHNLWTDDPASEPYKYGRGDGSTTMVLPDLRNVFIEGGDTPVKINAGAPNVTGGVDGLFMATNNATIAQFVECFSTSTKNTNTSQDIGAGSGTDSIWNLKFDASKSNAIYGNSDTIQPPAIVLIPQIKY